MANLSSMINRVQVLVGRHALATTDDVRGLINSRHSSLLESYDWHRKRQDIIITTAADKNTGTATVTSGSSTVVGSGTAWATSDEGRCITLGDKNSFYQIKSVASATSLTLGDLFGNTVTYAGLDATAQGFIIWTKRYPLGAGIEQIVSVRYQSKLLETSTAYIDSVDPARRGSGIPTAFARGERIMTGTNDIATVEFFPRPPAVPIAINVAVLLGHVDLHPSDNPIVPSGPLEWAAAVDVAYMLHARTADTKGRWLTLADKWNTEFEKALERELRFDASKFGVIQQVADVYHGGNLGDDFLASHDLGD